MTGDRSPFMLDQGRDNLVAGAEPLRTPWMERASGGDIDRARHITFQNRPSGRSFLASPDLRHRGKKYLCIRMQRSLEQFLGLCVFDDPAQVHNSDRVAEVFDDPQVMADKEKGYLGLLLQVLEEVQYLRLDRHIKGRKRLIGNDQLRRNSKRPCDTYPLSLAAAELMGITVQELRCEADPAR